MKAKLPILFIIILGTVLYTLTIRGVSGNPDILTIKAEYEGNTNPLELSPERGRFAHVMSLAKLGRYELGEQLGMLAYPDVGYIDNRFYSFFAPGISYMAYPFYLLGEKYGIAQVATFSFIPVMSILAMIFIFKIAREILKLPVWASIVAPIVFAFGSTAWSYAITLYQHHPTVFFITSGFYAAWRYSLRTKYSGLWGIWVWSSYALALTVDYPNAVLMLPVMVYFFFTSWDARADRTKLQISFRPAILFTAIAFIIISGAHLYHNKFHFDGWFNLSGELPSYKNVVEDTLDRSKNIGQGKNAIRFFSEQRIVRGLEKLTVSTDRGIFFFAPVFIFGFLGIGHAIWKYKSPELVALAATVAVNFFLYSSWGDPWGGWAYGPRYLIISMGILSLFIGWWVHHFRRWYWFLLIAVLFAYSSAIGLLGALTTNAVPPDVEAVALGTPGNYFRNLEFLKINSSSSYIFREFFKEAIPLWEYFSLIYAFVFAVFIYALSRAYLAKTDGN